MREVEDTGDEELVVAKVNHPLEVRCSGQQSSQAEEAFQVVSAGKSAIWMLIIQWKLLSIPVRSLVITFIIHDIPT